MDIAFISSDVINTVIRRPANMGKHLIIDAIIISISLLQNIPSHMIFIKFFNSAKRSVEAGLRGAMIRKLQQLSITFHKNMASGKIQSKVMRDVEAVMDFTNSIFDDMFKCVVQMTITLTIVITHNIDVFFMFLVCVPLAVLIRKYFHKPMSKRSHEFRKEIENASAAVLDMEELVPVTRAHALEEKEIQKLTTTVVTVAEKGYKLDRVQSIFGSVTWVTINIIQVICLFITAIMAIKGKISAGEITLYQSYFSQLTGYVSSFIGLLPIITRGSEAMKSIGEILSAYDIEDNSNKKKVKCLKGEYQFKNVSFNYDNHTPVLSNLNLTVNKGETIALVGESGSGKSTIINLVIGFNKATSGEIFIDGMNINEIDLHAYRKMISVVPQNSIVFSGTIRDNITYGKPEITEEQLQNAVHMAQLDSVIEKLPDGLNTIVGEHGCKLSGGQKQRISIARAIIRNPKVIIFDEATSALDSVTEREIQTAIDYLTKDRTTFIVAHRLSTIKNSDKIAVIKDGKCIEFGTYNELLSKKGEFYHYKEMQT